MDKVKALLLPLALVFAAISIFEFGSRYGATNVRVAALAGQLQSSLSTYILSQQINDPRHTANIEAQIDMLIATASLKRNVWYLKIKEEPIGSLDKVLRAALSLRGDAVIERFESMEDSENFPGLDQAKLNEIRVAIREAKVELVDNAPAPEETPAEPEEAEALETEPAAN